MKGNKDEAPSIILRITVELTRWLDGGTQAFDPGGSHKGGNTTKPP